MTFSPELSESSSGTEQAGPLGYLKRRHAAGRLATAVGFSVIFWYFGANVWRAVLLGLTTTIIVVSVTAILNLEVSDRTASRGGSRRRALGTRNDVTRLSQSLRFGWGRVDFAAQSRVRRLAQQRLASRRLDLHNPADRAAIERLIGRRAYTALVNPRAKPVRLRTLVYCLDVLDTLPWAPAGAQGQEIPARSPTSAPGKG
ncbi:MAG: hypothetical protein ACP5H2_06890 [Solirubrobacteraceae bacterium]